jgi:hypothetical protein
MAVVLLAANWLHAAKLLATGLRFGQLSFVHWYLAGPRSTVVQIRGLLVNPVLMQLVVR